jgi:hypothetical protein
MFSGFLQHLGPRPTLMMQQQLPVEKANALALQALERGCVHVFCRTIELPAFVVLDTLQVHKDRPVGRCLYTHEVRPIVKIESSEVRRLRARLSLCVHVATHSQPHRAPERTNCTRTATKHVILSMCVLIVVRQRGHGCWSRSRRSISHWRNRRQERGQGRKKLC